MESMAKKLDEAVELALDSPAEILWMCENLSCDMTPPSRFEEYNLKCYQKYSKWAHEAGKLLFMHVDGKAKQLVDVLNKTGMDGFESVSDPIMAGDMTYEEFLNAFPDKGILPNLPANLADDTEGKLEEFIKKTKAISKKYNRALMIQVSEDLRPDLYATALPRLLNAIND